MERAEEVQSEVERLRADAAGVEGKRAAAVGRRDAAVEEIDNEAYLTQQAREAVVRDVGGELLSLYEKVRASSAGIGAAELKQRRCQGCRLELNTVDLARFRDAPSDEVLRCEECRRILVRTAESGL
nr:C4-type zinc ribbon domain-containing protein [Motilibacter deserti]